jgi:hypothetical protein
LQFYSCVPEESLKVPNSIDSKQKTGRQWIKGSSRYYKE